jgi:hypothetical protein
MTQKVVDLTIKNLDITQLLKIRQDVMFETKNCNINNLSGAYRYELRELIDSIIAAGYDNKKEIVAPSLTI